MPAKTKSGRWSKKTVQERKECRKLIDETKALIASVYEKIDLWNKMEDGDEDGKEEG